MSELPVHTANVSESTTFFLCCPLVVAGSQLPVHSVEAMGGSDSFVHTASVHCAICIPGACKLRLYLRNCLPVCLLVCSIMFVQTLIPHENATTFSVSGVIKTNNQ